MFVGWQTVDSREVEKQRLLSLKHLSQYRKNLHANIGSFISPLMVLQMDLDTEYLLRMYQLLGKGFLCLIMKKTLHEEIVESIRNGAIADQKRRKCRTIFSASTSKNWFIYYC